MTAASLKDMRLTNVAWILCAVILLASPGFAAGPGAANGRTLYKWVDEQGVTHYGDRIPPEYATQERHVINSHGVEINRLEAQKTPEALAAEDQKKLEAEQSKFEVGMSTNYFVVQAQRDLRDAQNSELRAVLNYRKALVEFERLQQTTLQNLGITVINAAGGNPATTRTTTGG